jgi:hypothetical protein
MPAIDRHATRLTVVPGQDQHGRGANDHHGAAYEGTYRQWLHLGSIR